MKKVVAVVLNWNRPDDTVNCVQSLQQSDYPKLEVIVVDNASTDDSVARFRSELPDVQVLTCALNGGYAAGNNAGIKQALGHGADYVLVINNDVVATRGFLGPMIAEAEADPSVGVVTCDARFQGDTSRPYPTGGRISRVRAAGVVLPKKERAQRSTVDFVSGCILLVRREVFETAGLFDESFFMYFEDVEFSRRVGATFKLVYTPQAVVYHRSGGGDTWATQTPTYLYYMARNRFIAFRNEPAAYRAYLVLIGLASAIAKSAPIALHGVGTGSLAEARAQLKALWGGLAAGLTSRSARPADRSAATQGGAHR